MGITKFIWDPVFDCVSHELDENNNVKAVYHNEPQQYGGVLSQRRGTISHYHHHDALGSTRFLTDSSGNVTDTYLNDAWGNSVASTGATVNPFKWVGKYGYYTDHSTGQVYVRARIYQPTVASWLSVDPLFVSPNGWGYFYDLNSPVNAPDPSGFDCFEMGPGVHYVPGRGTFGFSAVPGRFSNLDELSLHIGISFYRNDDPNPFISDNGCCCCDRIEFIQLARTDWESDNILSNVLLGVEKNKWEVDAHPGQLHYPYREPHRSPCSRNGNVPVCSMNDAPSVPLGPRFFGMPTWFRIYAAEQEFETCAVCFCGAEGVRTNTGQFPPWHATTMYVYGCIRWFHWHHMPHLVDGGSMERGFLIGSLRRTRKAMITGHGAYDGGVAETGVAPSAPSERFTQMVQRQEIDAVTLRQYIHCGNGRE